MKLKILTLFLLLTFSLSQTPDEKPVAIEDLYFVDGHYLSSYKREIDSFNQGFGPIKALLNKQIAYDKDFNETLNWKKLKKPSYINKDIDDNE